MLDLQNLTDDELINVISKTPLISIDFIVKDSEGKILMGKRTNKPAQGKWFVPGGRIYKDESLDGAFERISQVELGHKMLRENARLIGVFTHNYDCNFKSIKDITTHYIVLAYEISLKAKKYIKFKVNSQHSKFKWITRDGNLLDIHKYASEYFNHINMINKEQYSILNARRDSFNGLLWQTPVLSITAQAFIFTIILSSSTTDIARLFASILSVTIALASAQLLSKHRFMEAEHAKILHNYEKNIGIVPINEKFQQQTWYGRLSSYLVWNIVLWAFAVIAVLAKIIM